jgi:hypothetical protein
LRSASRRLNTLAYIFFLSLLALFFANNTLFWVPGSYDWFTFVAATVAITLAIVFAWLSSRRFVASEGHTGNWKEEKPFHRAAKLRRKSNYSVRCSLLARNPHVTQMLLAVLLT